MAVALQWEEPVRRVVRACVEARPESWEVATDKARGLARRLLLPDGPDRENLETSIRLFTAVVILDSEKLGAAGNLPEGLRPLIDEAGIGLAELLRERYDLNGDRADLDEAAALLAEALRQTAAGDRDLPHRTQSSTNSWRRPFTRRCGGCGPHSRRSPGPPTCTLDHEAECRGLEPAEKGQ